METKLWTEFIAPSVVILLAVASPLVEGRIEQEICAFECASSDADIRWTKEVAIEFGLGNNFADRASECARSGDSNARLCDSGIAVYVTKRDSSAWVRGCHPGTHPKDKDLVGGIFFEHLLINSFGRWCEKSNTTDIEYCYCRHNGCNVQTSTDRNFVDIDLWPEEEGCVSELT